jgi:hypothetical protein
MLSLQNNFNSTIIGRLIISSGYVLLRTAEVGGLEGGPLSLVTTTEELLE